MTKYINVDEAVKHFRKWEFTDDFPLIKETLDEIPSADVRENIHGKWINDKGLYKCSVCNEFWSHFWASIGDERMNKIMKFCPNCGADMRERKETE